MSRPKTMVEEFTSTPEGMRKFQEERFFLDALVLIRKTRKEQGVSEAELARRIGSTEGYVKMVLAGHVNLTMRSFAEKMWALGKSLVITAVPLDIARGEVP